MPSDDLKDHATSDTDFYTLLGVAFETSQKDIDRAWRKTALKYHPDKVGNDPVARDKFHLAQIGYDLLSDPASKALYDNARNARLQRTRQNELFEGRRRQMKDDLEARERGVKRPREEDDEEKLEREIKRLAEDGKRRRKDREEALRRDMQREAEGVEVSAQAPGSDAFAANVASAAQSSVSEFDRTVKVRWPVDGDGSSMTADRVKSLFSKFGQVESADLLSPKMLRLGKKQKKQLTVVCMIQYKSVVGAHAAVEDFPRQEGPEWQIFDSVFWAANKEPDFISAHNAGSAGTYTAPPMTTPEHVARHWADSPASSKFSAPAASPRANGDSLKNKHSFASFSSARLDTPKGSPFGKGFSSVNSPSLEEMTMIRLKYAEKRRLAAEIEKQDADEDAAAESKVASL